MARTLVNTIDINDINTNIDTSVKNASKGYISGLNTVYITTNQLNIKAGACMDSTGQEVMILPALLDKNTSAWTQGNGGAFDSTGLASGATVNVFVIKNPTTEDVDVIFSRNATPDLPTGWTFFRRIASFRLNGTSFRPFFQIDDHFHYAPGPEVAVSITTAENDYDISALPQINGMANIVPSSTLNSSGGRNTCVLGVPDQDLAEPTHATLGGASTGGYMRFGHAASGSQAGDFGIAMHSTNSTAIVPFKTGRLRMQYSNNNGTIRLYVVGWIDFRGKDE